MWRVVGWGIGILMLPLIVAPNMGWAQTTLGEEFQVNTYTTGSQGEPDVAEGGDNGFIVVWAGRGSADTRGIFVQRYDSDGSALGGEFQVNTYTTSTQDYGRVGSNADGDFVVVWKSTGSVGDDTDYHTVQGQRFSSDGSTLGTQFQVNTYTTEFQNEAVVAMRDDGGFVVTWQSTGSSGDDADGRSIQARIYDAFGTPIGSDFQVNTYTTSVQSRPDLAMAPNGSFVIVFDSGGSSGSDTHYNSVQAQMRNSTGSLILGEFQVNTYTTESQSDPKVALAPDGSFLVVWRGAGGVGPDPDAGIQGQYFDSIGTPVGGEFQINNETTGYQFDPAVASDGYGNFIVVWESQYSGGSDTDGQSTKARVVRKGGMPIGDEFQVNTYTTDDQDDPVVAIAPDQTFLVVWEGSGSSGTDTDALSVQAQRFRLDPIFADGFESGNTSSWTD